MSDVIARKAGRREWIGLAVLALPTLLLSLDVSVLYLALPHMSSGLAANGSEQLWMLDIYSFMLAGFLVTMGTLGDRIGRRKLLLIGATAFSVASVVAAYSTSPVMLIAARALLGVAGASVMPSTMGLIRNMFHDPNEMGTAISVWFCCFMGGMAIGPLVGGVLLQHFWWGSAFLLGVPVMVLLLVLGPVLLPEHRDPHAGRLDLMSVFLSLAAILPAIYGLKELARSGAQPLPIAATVVGVLVGVVFVHRQRQLASPLLDLRLFSSRAFSVGLGLMLLSGVVMAGASLMSTLYLQVVQGLSPLTAGLWLLPQNFAMILGSLLAPLLVRRFQTSYVMAAGLLISGAGLLLHTQVDASNGLPLLITGLILASGGIALPLPLVMNVVMQAAPPEKAGSAASMSETSGEFGIALGVAMLGSLGTLIYRSVLTGSLPAGVPTDIATTARESITAAMLAAQQLPAPLSSALLDSARYAFTSGLNTVGGVGGSVFIALAILTVAVLRQRATVAAATQPATA